MRLIRHFVALIALSATASATTTVQIVPTAQQAVLYAHSDQLTDTCSIEVWTVNKGSGDRVLINDVNTAFFAAADQCSREGNAIRGPNIVFVIGKRSAELDLSG